VIKDLHESDGLRILVEERAFRLHCLVEPGPPILREPG